MVIRVFIASSSGFVAVSTAGTRGGGPPVRVLRQERGARPSASPCAARRAARAGARQVIIHTRTMKRTGAKVGGGPGLAPSCSCTTREETAREAPSSSCVAREFGQGVVQELRGLTSLGVNYSRFWTFSLVKFCTGAFSVAWFANLALE